MIALTKHEKFLPILFNDGTLVESETTEIYNHNQYGKVGFVALAFNFPKPNNIKESDLYVSRAALMHQKFQDNEMTSLTITHPVSLIDKVKKYFKKPYLSNAGVIVELTESAMEQNPLLLGDVMNEFNQQEIDIVLNRVEQARTLGKNLGLQIANRS